VIICIILFERRVHGILGSEVQRKVLVIIGLGATGLEVAKRAKSFGMHVIAVTKNPFLKKPGIDIKKKKERENVIND
jgi:D-3-phosphoglycerate dehydrogenase